MRRRLITSGFIALFILFPAMAQQREKTAILQAEKAAILQAEKTAILQKAAAQQVEKTTAFPGAEGFGRYTTGGRGGKVYHVTNLNDAGTGSLRWANLQPGPRTIVFDVSGTIYLKSALKIANNTTLAGQTAPGDGICVADYPVTLGSNVICRYMRFRLGQRQVAYHEGDGLGAMDNNNIIVDHCSVSWSIDECLSVYGGRNLTVQWCITAQSLVNSGHSKGAHGYGGNWGGAGASFHHNLIAHHTSRTPRLGPRTGTQTDERMDMRNNVIYNWGGNGCYGGEGMKVNIVNNYYKPGPGTLKRNTTVQQRIAAIGIRTSEYTEHNSASPNQWDVMWHVWGKFYVDGNVNSLHSNVTSDNWTYGMYNQISNGAGVDYTYTQATRDTMRILEPIPYVCVTTHTADVAYQRVLDHVGASLHRDQLDNIIIDDVRNGRATFTGSNLDPGFINSQDDVAAGISGDDSPWPALQQQTAPADSDGDGMPDDWETANGLNPNDATDGNQTTDEGYTMLEVYMNTLVADITAAQNEGGEETGYKEYREVNPGGDESGLVVVGTGDVVWEFSSGTDGQTATFADGIETLLGGDNIVLGDGLTFGGIQNINGLRFSKIAPKNDNESAANDGNAIAFSFTAQEGCYFRPTRVAAKISRLGTDGGSVDLYWRNDNGTYPIEQAIYPDRNNTVPGYTAFNKDITDIGSAAGTSTLLLHVYKLAQKKQLGIRDVVVSGEVKQTSTGISTVSNGTISTRRYTLMGTAAGIGTNAQHEGITRQRGLIIEVTTLPDGTRLTRKVVR